MKHFFITKQLNVIVPIVLLNICDYFHFFQIYQYLRINCWNISLWGCAMGLRPLPVVVQRRNSYQKIQRHQISGGTAHRNGPDTPPSGHFARNKYLFHDCAPFWWSDSDETYIRRFSIIELVGVQHIVRDLTRHLEVNCWNIQFSQWENGIFQQFIIKYW